MLVRCLSPTASPILCHCYSAAPLVKLSSWSYVTFSGVVLVIASPILKFRSLHCHRPLPRRCVATGEYLRHSLDFISCLALAPVEVSSFVAVGALCWVHRFSAIDTLSGPLSHDQSTSALLLYVRFSFGMDSLYSFLTACVTNLRCFYVIPDACFIDILPDRIPNALMQVLRPCP